MNAPGIGDYMTRTLTIVEPTTKVRHLVELLQKHHIRHLPVLEGTRLVGMVADRDVRRALPSVINGATANQYDEAMDHLTAAQVMTRSPATIDARATLHEAVAKMRRLRIASLPVVEVGAIVGILTESDLLRALEDFTARTNVASGEPADLPRS